MSNKKRLYEIIFEADTPAGKVFDIALIICIIFSVFIVMIESVKSIQITHGRILNILELVFTLIFSIEYGMRIYCSKKPKKYIFSFFGLVDLMSILPTFIAIMLPGTHYLAVVRILRVLRIFRILKFMQYIKEAKLLLTVLKKSIRKIVLFISTVMTISIILGSIMYIVEGEVNGYDNIPKSVYWAIVTLTTVGYGDMAPKTNIGQAIATIIMILGYSIIVVPTGFVSAEIASSNKPQICEKCKDKE